MLLLRSSLAGLKVRLGLTGDYGVNTPSPRTSVLLSRHNMPSGLEGQQPGNVEGQMRDLEYRLMPIVSSVALARAVFEVDLVRASADFMFGVTLDVHDEPRFRS